MTEKPKVKTIQDATEPLKINVSQGSDKLIGRTADGKTFPITVDNTNFAIGDALDKHIAKLIEKEDFFNLDDIREHLVEKVGELDAALRKLERKLGIKRG